MRFKEQVTNNRSIIESFLSLSILNGLNLLLPLVTLPYLLRVIGPEKYGIYSFVYVIIQYLLLLSSYGFNFSATKQVSQYRDNINEVSRIYIGVITARLLLTFIGLILFSLISFYVLKSKEEFNVFEMGVGIVLGDIFIPVWLFQGMEKMRYLTLVNVISKIVFTILIFFVIISPEDYKYIILLNSLGYVAAGICSTIIVKRFFKINFFIPSWNDIWFQLRDGFHVSGSTLSMNLYRNSNIFILGLFANDASVGIYSAAEKLIKALQGILSPVAEALFPHLGYKFQKNKDVKDSVRQLNRFIRPYAVLLFFLFLLVLIFAPFLSNILLGKSFFDSIPLIRIMSLVIVVGGLNYVLGIVGLINLNKQSLFFRNVIISGVIGILVMLFLVHSLTFYAGAISMVLSELILFILCTRSLYLIGR